MQKNGLKVLLYLLTVAVLVTALGFVIYQHRVRMKEEIEYVSRIAGEETAPDFEVRTATGVMNETETETETITETETASAAATEAEETETESETEFVAKTAKLLILNGTRVEGVAARWENILRDAGFLRVSKETYTQPVEDKTVIYTDIETPEDAFRKWIPDSTVVVDQVPGEYETEATLRNPDYVIVIGRDDARNLN